MDIDDTINLIKFEKGDYMPEQLKSRVLTIFQILWKQTDENHPITIRHIQAQLQDIGISAGRKTIADDIVSLREAGYDIICNKRQQNQYFIGSRDFELPELMMLINAVQAVHFITPRKRKKLISKLSAEASRYQAQELLHLTKANPAKQDPNHSIYYTIEDIRVAISKNQKVSFQYLDYTVSKERILKHDGYEYYLSPYDLMWSGDLYYVIGFSERHEKVATFRVDRMVNLVICDEIATPHPVSYHVEEYRRRIFQMYGGTPYQVVMRCENSLMNAVIDKFGIDCNIKPDGNTHFFLIAEVATSPTFFSWIFNFAGQMEIISPSNVVKEYRQRLKMALTMSTH